jgi:hypothetical protein
LYVSGVGSALPAVSVAKTVNLCLPGLSFFALYGDEQGFAAFLSSLQVNVAAGSEEKVKVAFVAVVLFFGPLVMVVYGGVVSRATTTSSAPMSIAEP